MTATTNTYDAAKTAQLERSADGGGILANQILGARYALPVLRCKYELVTGRITRIAAGRTPHNTDAEYAQIIAQQIGALNDVMQYNHPDAAYYASQDAARAFRTKGLPGLLDVITEYGRRAAELATVPERAAQLRTAA
jgi:hypothetical protein